MRQQMPTSTESAEELRQRLQQATESPPRPRVPALDLVVSGPARSRQARAAWVGVHRPSGAAGRQTYAAGGGEQRLRSHVPPPPRRQRLTPTALATRQAPLQAPRGCAGDAQRRPWLAAPPQVPWSYAGG
jgi:hypothetical protein